MSITSKHPFVDAVYKPSPSLPTGACRSKSVNFAGVVEEEFDATVATDKKVRGANFAEKPLAEVALSRTKTFTSTERENNLMVTRAMAEIFLSRCEIGVCFIPVLPQVVAWTVEQQVTYRTQMDETSRVIETDVLGSQLLM